MFPLIFSWFSSGKASGRLFGGFGGDFPIGFGQFYGRNCQETIAQIFGQVFDQIFGQGLGEGKPHKYSVQCYWNGKIQRKVLLGRKNLLHRFMSKKHIHFFWYP